MTIKPTRGNPESFRECCEATKRPRHFAKSKKHFLLVAIGKCLI